MIIAIICAIVTICAIIILTIKIKSDKLNYYNTKVVECEKKLQVSLEEKFSLLCELQSKISDQSDDAEFNLLCDIDEIKDDDFMLNAILNKAYNEIKVFLDERRAYIPDEDIKDLLNKLHQTDIECIALKNYYNDYTKIINSLIKKFPNNIIAKFQKISNRELYNDPVEEEFEILKKK